MLQLLTNKHGHEADNEPADGHDTRPTNGQTKAEQGGDTRHNALQTLVAFP
jgi:hypothetical protein